MESEVLVKARAAKAGAQELALVGTDTKNKALAYLADELERQAAYIIEANHLDIAAARNNGMSEAMLDRLKLTEQRIHDMAAGVRQVIELSDPVGRCLAEWDRPNGLHICKVLVNLAGGQIRVESKQGEWCRFVFTLPVEVPGRGDLLKLSDDTTQPGSGATAR